MNPENKRLHLELIQGVINRLAQNSFSMKGWAVTLISAIFVLTKDPSFHHIMFFPVIVFWGLDAYYQRQERLFRKLYDAVSKDSPSSSSGGTNDVVSGDGIKIAPFSMDTLPFKNLVNNWFETLFAGAIAGLYLPMILLITIISFFPQSMQVQTLPSNSHPSSEMECIPHTQSLSPLNRTSE